MNWKSKRGAEIGVEGFLNTTEESHCIAGLNLRESRSRSSTGNVQSTGIVDQYSREPRESTCKLRLNT